MDATTNLSLFLAFSYTGIGLNAAPVATFDAVLGGFRNMCYSTLLLSSIQVSKLPNKHHA